MKNQNIIPSKLYLMTVVVCVALFLSSISVSYDIQLIFFVLMISLIGVPHGAFDAILSLSFLNKGLRQGTVITLISFSALYLMVALLSMVFWYYFSIVSLCLFLILSIYHFSQDWRDELPLVMRVSISGILICGPSILYDYELVVLFNYLWISQENAALIVEVMSFSYLIFGLLLLKHLPKFFSLSNWRQLEIASVCICAIVFPPILHFVLYFCFLHSLKHINDVFRCESLSSRQLIFVALPIAVFAVSGMYGAFYLSQAISPQETTQNIFRVIFVGLFGLTVAHMLVIHRWHRWLRYSSQDDASA